MQTLVLTLTLLKNDFDQDKERWNLQVDGTTVSNRMKTLGMRQVLEHLASRNCMTSSDLQSATQTAGKEPQEYEAIIYIKAQSNFTS